MRSKIAQELWEESTEDERIFVEKMLRLSLLIEQTLDEKNWKHKDLAEALGKRPSEISKWLNGHNLTMRSISKLEAVLNVELFRIDKPHQHQEDPVYYGTVHFVPEWSQAFAAATVRPISSIDEMVESSIDYLSVA